MTNIRKNFIQIYLRSTIWDWCIISCRIFGSIGNPALKKLEIMLYPPLSYFDHLVSVKITISSPSLIPDLGSGQTGSAVLSMHTSKHHLTPKYMFVYFVSYRYLESDKAKVLSDPRLL